MFEKLKRDLKKPTAEWIQEVTDENEKLRSENSKQKSLLDRAEKLIAKKYFDSRENREWLSDFSAFQSGGENG